MLWMCSKRGSGSLPIVFVCGLVERHFPQYHREDPLLNDAARRRAGLATSFDRQREEKFLFELATTRATEQLILSYPQFNERGDEAIPSFFLEGSTSSRAQAVRESETRATLSGGDAILRSTTALLRDRLAERHGTLAPTSIESFLQCPFQFFAAKTLRLRPRPAAADDRLNVLLQGSIIASRIGGTDAHAAAGDGDFRRNFSRGMPQGAYPGDLSHGGRAA